MVNISGAKVIKKPLMKKSLDERRDMILHGSILKTLMFLSFPTLLMNMVQSLIPLVDSFYLNHSAGENVAAAVGFVVPIVAILNGISQGLGVSGMALIGNANGKGDKERVRHISTQLMVFGFIMGCFMAPLSYISGAVISRFIGSDISGEVYKYMALYSFVMPFLFLTALFNAIKNATGQPEATLYRMVFLLVLKIVFNYIYLYIFHWGTAGSVLGSFSSYGILAIWMYYDLFVKKSELKLTTKGFHFDKDVIKPILKIGIPAMLNTMTVNLGFVLINLEVQKYGGNVLNAETIASNLSNISYLLPSSLGTTVTTMVSMNMGLGEKKRAKDTLFIATIVAGIISVALIIGFMPIARPLVTMFVNKKDMIKIAEDAITIYNFSIIGFSLYMTVQGAFIGLGRTKIPLITGLLRVWFFRYIFVMITEKTMEVYSVFWGNLFSNTAAGLLCLLIVMKIDWKVQIGTTEEKMQKCEA